MRDCCRIRAVDIAALLLIAVYALAALAGVLEISANGTELDSDLGMYAYITAGEQHPESFSADPTAALHSHSFWNAARYLGALLTPGNEYAVGLLRAGALAVFVFYAGFYLLGRWLFGGPILAAVLSLVMGVTVWVGWGTFWGVTHSDPVPRVFFAALFPFLLWGGIAALRHVRARPLVMLAAGLCVWVHNISALATGAMLFMAFALNREKRSWAVHLGILAVCLLCFFLPVLFSLRSLLGGQAAVLSADNLAVLRYLFDLRLGADYGRMLADLGGYLLTCSVMFPLFPAACAGWLITVSAGWGGGERARDLARMYPGMLLALALVALFSWAEFQLAARLGRLPLGHDLIRGTRFLVPLAWLMVVSGVACFWPRLRKIFRFSLLAGIALAVLLLNQDRWHMGALHSLARHTGLTLPLQDRAEDRLRHNAARREALEKLSALTRPGDVVFSDNGDSAIRYLALRGLFHSFKDGLYPYYGKDADWARVWLRYNALMQRGPTGYIDAWLASGVSWLLSGRPQDRALLEPYGDVLWENKGWLIVRRR